MQETRRLILDILRERAQATVDDIVVELRKRRGDITAVTVRHHLTRLQEDELITAPEMRRRNAPGRPQHMYALTEKAQGYFPNNYQLLATSLFEQMQRHLPPDGVNVIFEGVATAMAANADIPAVPLDERLDHVVSYLTEHGYCASWEACEDGYILSTSNCPYHKIASSNGQTICDLDMRLVSELLGVVPRRISHRVNGDTVCAYLIPHEAD